jgi:hypothetical protein
MIITAEQARKRKRINFTQEFASHVLILAKMTHKEIDIVRWVLTWTERMLDKNEKALILSAVAKVLTDGGEPQKGKYILQAALNSARLAGQETVLNTLATGASTVAAIDQGRTLWQAYQALLEVESWWSKI